MIEVPMSQIDHIYAHLISKKSITALEALKKYGCFRLAARINELKKDCGMNIKKVMIEYADKRVAKYYL